MLTDRSVSLAFNTLAHPRRARLYRLLSIEPEAGRSFSALMAASGYSKNPLEHHLAVMEKGGLIRRRRRGQVMTFRLDPRALGAAFEEFDRLRGPDRFGPVSPENPRIENKMTRRRQRATWS